MTSAPFRLDFSLTITVLQCNHYNIQEEGKERERERERERDAFHEFSAFDQ